MKHTKKIALELTNDQALVLFELFASAPESGQLTPRHSSEQNALWAIEAQLEKALSEPFDPNYQALLEAARKRLADEE